jgi:hypothetical protein
MVATFVSSVRSEWLKTKRGHTMWLVLVAAFFVPTIIATIRLIRPAGLPELYRRADFWPRLWVSAWESMALMILPFTIILTVSLITQIEYRNNAWKQLHASPQPLATIFFAKLSVILTMVERLFGWFNVAIYLTALVPALLLPSVTVPEGAIPFTHFLRRNISFLLDALPVVGLQYLLALRFRSFVIPLGVGLALWIVALASLAWEFNYVVPYSYLAIDYTTEVPSRVSHQLPVSTPVLGIGSFLAFTLAGYVLYVRRTDRG